MFQWNGSLFAATLAIGVLCSPSLSCAKPPDLPADISQHCPEGRDGQQADGFTPRLAAQEAQTPPLPAQRALDPLTPRDCQARHLFNIAERCRIAGDFDKARTCYEETHLLSPTSYCGRLAIDRLRDIDRIRQGAEPDSAEESEAAPERLPYRETSESHRRLGTQPQPRPRDTNRSADDDTRRQEMLRSTVPLETQPQRTEDEAARLPGTMGGFDFPFPTIW